MSKWLPAVIAGGIIGFLVLSRAGYVAHSNLNDPDENYQTGSKYMDNSIFTGFFGKSGGGKKTIRRKYKKVKNTRRK